MYWLQTDTCSLPGCCPVRGRSIRPVLYSENVELSTDQKGAIAESAIVHAAIKLGIGVLKPLTDGHRYDLVFDLESETHPYSMQVAVLVGDVVAVRCYSCRRTRDGLLKRGYSAEEVDGLAAYCLDVDRCFYFDTDWLQGRTHVHLRLSPTRNNQRDGMNWAEDFAFERLRLGVPGP